jgi:NAD(P)-dependent dehydrogenase (short-subunit alcohol dehydrogenase family)
MYDFSDKIAVVTGAANGIGRASAIRFAAAGAQVIAADIDEKMAGETSDLAGKNCVSMHVDVSDEVSCQELISNVVGQYGSVDILCNNAGIPGTRARVADMSTAAWDKVMRVNLDGVFFCSRAALPAMERAGGGVIVNIASVDGQVGMSELSHYVAAKHGVVGLSKTIALEYAKQNIRCMSVAPGYVKTNMTQHSLSETEQALFSSLTPIGRPADPEEISNLIIWLASQEASYVTGSCFTIDGGILSGFQLPD